MQYTHILLVVAVYCIFIAMAGAAIVLNDIVEQNKSFKKQLNELKNNNPR